MIRNLVMEKWNGPVVIILKDSSLMMLDKGMVKCFGKMALIIKVNGIMDHNKDMEDYLTIID